MLTQDWINVKLEAAKEVCMYCADHCPQYETWVSGPNTAGNFVHPMKWGEGIHRVDRETLCQASNIYHGIWRKGFHKRVPNAIRNVPWYAGG